MKRIKIPDPQLDPNLIKIRDLGLAAYIFSNDVKPLKTERVNDVVFFYFPKETAGRLVDSYWNDTEPFIPARELFSAQRSLKDLIFSGGKSG